MNRQQWIFAQICIKSYSFSGNTNLERLQTDIAVIKSLLLRGDQFPSVPTVQTTTNGVLGQTRSAPKLNGQEIPAWQLTNKESTELSDSTIENLEPEDSSMLSANEA